MARWIVFDEVTAVALRSHLPHHAVFEAPGRTAFEYALTTPRTVITVLGQTGSGKATIAVFRPKGEFATQPHDSETVHPPDVSSPTRAGGFLGLSDHLVTEDEEEADEKRWWQFWR